MSTIVRRHFDLSGILHLLLENRICNFSHTAVVLSVVSITVTRSTWWFPLRVGFSFSNPWIPARCVWHVEFFVFFFMWQKAQLVEVSNDEKSGVSSGFVFLSRSCLCFHCRNFGHGIALIAYLSTLWWLKASMLCPSGLSSRKPWSSLDPEVSVFWVRMMVISSDKLISGILPGSLFPTLKLLLIISL